MARNVEERRTQASMEEQKTYMYNVYAHADEAEKCERNR